MSDRNRRTIDTYNNYTAKYIESTARTTSGFQKEWLDDVLSDVSSDAAILEIGSAFGRDAAYIESKGYSIDRTDASVGFVEYLNGQGCQAELLDIIHERPKRKYNIILACAVFLHFTDTDFQQAARNVRESLCDGGRFIFSVKLGEGEEWTEDKMGAPRYFNYYSENSLKRALAAAGMETQSLLIYDNKWIHAVSMAGNDDIV